MRIGLFIDTPVFGGAEAVVLSLHGGLSELGVTPVLYCFKNPEFESRCRMLGIEYIEAPAHVDYKSAWSLLSFARKFGARLRADRIDLLHSHLLGPIVGGHLAAKVARIPHLGTLHDSYTLLERPIWFKVLRLLSMNGTRLVGVSDQLSTIVTSRSGLPAGNVRTIYNGLDTAWTASASRSNLRTELGVGADDLVVSSVGRLVALKRHELLIRAVTEVSAHRSVKLLIAGEGEERASLESLIRELRAESFVHLMGFQEDIASLLSASDLFALTSSTEGLSCSIMEAMLAALPCVVSDVGGNRELIQSSDQGVVLPDVEVSTIANALMQLASDPERRALLGKNARDRALELSNVSRMSREYCASYERCVTAYSPHKKVALSKQIAAL